MTYGKKDSWFGAILGFILVVVIIFALIGSHTSRHTYTVKVTDKIVKQSKDSSKYLIFTEANGDEKVFEDTDSLIEGKWDSSDIYAQLKKNHKYTIKTYGWRIPFMSWYENIVDVENAN